MEAVANPCTIWLYLSQDQPGALARYTLPVPLEQLAFMLVARIKVYTNNAMK